MTKKFKYLDELTDKTKDYKVKVKVIEKSRVKQSPGKTARQPLVLRDEKVSEYASFLHLLSSNSHTNVLTLYITFMKGTTMRAIIFGDDIARFEQAIERDKVYEIGGATIVPVAKEYQQKENEFQMTISKKVDHLVRLPEESSNSGPNYLQLHSIPRTGDMNNNLIGNYHTYILPYMPTFKYILWFILVMICPGSNKDLYLFFVVQILAYCFVQICCFLFCSFRLYSVRLYSTGNVIVQIYSR